jgi:hypothetical protein
LYHLLIIRKFPTGAGKTAGKQQEQQIERKYIIFHLFIQSFVLLNCGKFAENITKKSIFLPLLSM